MTTATDDAYAIIRRDGRKGLIFRNEQILMIWGAWQPRPQVRPPFKQNKRRY